MAARIAESMTLQKADVVDRGGFTSRLWAALGLRPTLKLRRAEGLLLVTDGRREIAITSAKRTRLYRPGINARLNRLRKAYSIGTCIPVAKGDLVVNFGANIGELVLTLAERGCRVVAIEPDPTTLQCLRHNVGAMADIVPTGLWNADREITFYQKPNSADTSAVNETAWPMVVAARRLDTVMAGYDGRIKIIVGDAEGAEPEVLEGATETLKRTAFLSIAVGPERKGEMTYEPCRTIVEQNGFEIIPVANPRFLVARKRD